jgi:DNA mismatch endonuclease, patch repair protein
VTDPMTRAERSAHMAKIGGGLDRNGTERRVHEVLKGLHVRHRMYPDVRPSADVAVPTRGPTLYVMVDGCFWHACPDHYRRPKTRAAFWRGHVEAAEARRQRLRDAAPWPWVRIWEHWVRDPLNSRDTVGGIILVGVRKVESGGVARGQVPVTCDDLTEVWGGPPWR